jgi:hypothetical protein
MAGKKERYAAVLLKKCRAGKKIYNLGCILYGIFFQKDERLRSIVLDTYFKVHPQNVRFQNVRFQKVWFQNV